MTTLSPFSGPVGVGFIGVGVISDTYLENLNSFSDVEVLILGDLDTERAASQAPPPAPRRTCWTTRACRSW